MKTLKQMSMAVGFFLTSYMAFCQTAPQGNPPANNTNARAAAAWYRGGNNLTNPNNIFGTMWNSPIYHYADGLHRMSVGFLPFGSSLIGIGASNPNPIAGNNLTRVTINRDGNNRIQRPLSLLHIGYDFDYFGGGLPQGGQRNWMDIGTMAMAGTDQIYVGMAQKSNSATGFPYTLIATPNDRQNAIVNWGDNPGGDPNGPDNLCFIYTAPPAQAATNPLGATNDGREIMRMIYNGNVGLGPVFSDGNQPKSNHHMHNENSLSNWLQITNENLPGVTQSNFPAVAGVVNANDGFRIGILGNNNGLQNGNALVYQQENRHLLFSTNANTNAINPLNTQERMRVTRIGAPTELPNNGYGNNNPAGLNANITRVSISHNPGNPVTRPLSLLHLGYNTGNAFAPAATDGWRPWMDVGTFTSNGTDNMYVGLKQEPGAFPANDRQDAVINWGDNDGALVPLVNPDMLRFIFTATQSLPSNAPGSSLNGLEIARMDPRLASTLPAPNYGMMGIGDFTVAAPIDAKLDIDGDLRIRTVTQNNALTQVLVIDPNDLNRVHWKDITAVTGGGFGSNCGSFTPTVLTVDNEVQLANNSFHFSGIGGTKQENNVGIGTNCQLNLAGKLHVNRASTDLATTAAYILNNDASNSNSSSSLGLFVKNSAVDVPNTSCRSVAGWFETVTDAAGVTGFALYVPDAGGRVSIGFGFNNTQPDNTEPDVCGLEVNSGALFEVNGPIYTSNLILGPSDINFKKNIAPITSALDKVKKLNGVYYDYDNTNYPNLNFSADRQVGLIAQNVDTVLTEVTKYDSTLQAFTMDYSRITALLIEAIKEQDNNIDSLTNELTNQDSINTALENRLLALEQCLSQTNLCNQQAKTSYDNSNEGQVIELSNANAIILDQNLPNPFAEKTSIAYSIPNDVFEAQLLFYDISGRIIKQVDITERGDGKITVYGENLKNGIYTYSLIADGKLIATKKMVKQ